MAIEQHIFDADGDLVLILSRPAGIEEDAPEVNSRRFRSGDEVTDTNIVAPDPNVQEVNEFLDAHPMTFDGSVDPDGVEIEKPEVEVRMLVSAKHMMLVSPVFKAMLQRGKFKEGKQLDSSGKVEVPLPDDEVSAFITILDIIHSRNRRVPRQISLHMLTSITILADKYQLVEALEAYSDAWIENLKPELLKRYVTESEVCDVHRWIGISWVFSKSDIFKPMTWLLERGCYDNIGIVIEDCLPIPEIVIKTITRRREDALSEIYALIEEAVEKCQHSDGLCRRTDKQDYKMACDAMLLGSLLRAAKSCQIYPPPSPPYFEVSATELIKKVRTMKVVALCDSISPPRQGYYEFGAWDHSHTIKELIGEKLKDVETRLSGLGLEEFKSKTPSA